MTTLATPLTPTSTIVPQGRYSLAEVASMGFGHRHDERFDGVMRMAFCTDGHGYGSHGAVEVRQDDEGVHLAVVAGDPDVVVAQAARILSLDHDGRAFDAIGHHDPVMARLMAVAPGLRPPLFHSPYEAAAWAVLSARRPARQMGKVRDALAQRHGASFDLAGRSVAAFPTPEQLLAVESFPGLDATKVERLHAVARAALEGRLDADHLLAIGPDEAAVQLQTLPGIGPFYAALVVVRATGFTDVLATEEPRVLTAVGSLYGLGRPATPAELTAIAQPWRPFRTWATVLIRAAGSRL